MNYQTLDSQLTGRNRDSRKLANNTYAERKPDGAIAIRLHQTDVLTFKPDGSIVADSGGWKTVTTKDRLNSYLPIRIHQERGQWKWDDGRLFTDGDTIAPDGTLRTQAQPSDDKAERTLRNRVAKYAKLCADSLPLERPGNGDCWYCVMMTQEGKSLGDASKNTEHLEHHLDENYVVPALVFHALKERGCGDFILSLAFTKGQAGSYLDIARDHVKRAVRKYMSRRLGLVS